MKYKIKKYAKELIVFIVVMSIFANIVSLYRSMDINKTKLDIKEVTLINNVNYTTPRDKPILLHFWATWCPACKMEAGNIQRLSKNYEVLTIALKSGSDEEISSYLKKNDLNYKVVNDNDGYITNKYKVSIFPTTIIYDKNREVVFSDVGYTSTLGLYLRMWWVSLI
jgi:thiol-disulfide isomerase/thioredoxin